jgi:hypothetical protein
MMLTAAKRSLSVSTGTRSWRDACAFARPTTSPAGERNYLNARQLGEGHGIDPGG